ncbi:phosphatase [Punctularia strigosozonata HHB-11173 SS5]|uniref:phosphatase n=1 Tax=Punctularia strigosozonata (strain HHB-11173) TaxID=741275 RepID=UPI0004417770|nr:phosphatase [Punctularia strigosozonata HHB-11173 SS5]EIN10887.1 phosphatase [Punctularia strigosozonata HHB-11173 SS5]
MPVITIVVDAILFDMDGTLVDSTKGVVGAWHHFKGKYPSMNVEEILNTSHGVRTVDNLRIHCGIEDPEELEREAERFEQAIIKCSGDDGQGIVLLPGVEAIMKELLPRSKLPHPRWAICTSATRGYASAALRMAGVPVPDVLVAAEDVEKGKPEPDPYLLGARKCSVNTGNCLVVEDAPAGVRSGQAAGCKTLGVTTSHSRAQMEACSPTYLVENLASVRMRLTTNGVEVTMEVV